MKRLAASFEVWAASSGSRRRTDADVVTAGVPRVPGDDARLRADGGAAGVVPAHPGRRSDGVDADAGRRRAGGPEGGEQTAREVAKARTRDSTRVLTRLADEIDGRLRFVADPPLIVPLDDMLPPGTAHEEIAEWMGSLVSTYRRSISPTPPSDRGVPLHGHRAQGRRRRERGDARVGPPVPRTRRRGPTGVAGQGGTAVGPGAIPG